MGNEMNKVLTGLYIGSVRDAHDVAQLSDNKISHILSIHENAKPDLPDMEYMCLSIADNPSQNIASYFVLCNDFIHKARHKGNILVHCQMGISRSATVVVAYLMTVSHCGWKDALGMLKSVRPYVNPNLGFQKQLMAFESELLEQERKRISQLSTVKRSEDFVESFKLLSILSCSKLEPQDRALNVDSDIYPLAKDAYGIKDLPIPLFSPTAVTFHEALLVGTNSADVASDSMLAETEKSSAPVSFPCKDYRSTERRGSIIEVPASASSISEVATDSVRMPKKDCHCVDEKALGSSFAKCLSVSNDSESKKNLRNKDGFARVRDSRSLTADAVRKIGREYLRKHVRIWHDLSDADDDDDDDGSAKCSVEVSPTPRNSLVPSESSITEEDEKPELVDGSTQTMDEIEAETSSKFVDSTTQTLPESDDSNDELSDNASDCKISKCLPLAKRLPKSKPVTDEIAHLASQNSLDVLPV